MIVCEGSGRWLISTVCKPVYIHIDFTQRKFKVLDYVPVAEHKTVTTYVGILYIQFLDRWWQSLQFCHHHAPHGTCVVGKIYFGLYKIDKKHAMMHTSAVFYLVLLFIIITIMFFSAVILILILYI